MSWGPRARGNYRLRRMARVAILREARRKGHAPPRMPRPSPKRDRDQSYAAGARNVFLWTLAAFFLAAFIPGFALLTSLLLLMLVVEAAMWVIYQAQFNAARRTANEDTLDEFGGNGLDRNILARHAAQAAERAAEAERAEAARKAETAYRQMLHGQILGGQRQEAARRQAEASQQFQAQAKAKQAHAKAKQEIIDQELRWARDAKHGKFGQGAVGEHDLNPKTGAPDAATRDSKAAGVQAAWRQQVADERAAPPSAPQGGPPAKPAGPDSDVERQIQMLERRIREGLPVEGKLK